MRLHLNNRRRQYLFTVNVASQRPPSVVRPPDGSSPEVYLDWSQALDDSGHLRCCPVCGCPDLFARKTFPQVTVFLAILLAAVAAVLVFGLARGPALAWGLTILSVVALLDLLVFLFALRRLVCYNCRSEFSRLPIPRRHPGWEPSVGERYRLPPIETASPAAAEPDPSTRNSPA